MKLGFLNNPLQKHSLNRKWLSQYILIREQTFIESKNPEKCDKTKSCISFYFNFFNIGTRFSNMCHLRLPPLTYALLICDVCMCIAVGAVRAIEPIGRNGSRRLVPYLGAAQSCLVCVSAKCQNSFTHRHMLRKANKLVHTLLTSDISVINPRVCGGMWSQMCADSRHWRGWKLLLTTDKSCK